MPIFYLVKAETRMVVSETRYKQNAVLKSGIVWCRLELSNFNEYVWFFIRDIHRNLVIVYERLFYNEWKVSLYLLTLLWSPCRIKLEFCCWAFLILFMAHIDSTLSHIHLHFIQCISCDTFNINPFLVCNMYLSMSRTLDTV